MAFIEIKNANKRYIQNDREFTALDNVSLEIQHGEFICLLGPSGCGKTTLLNMMAGFEKPDSGSIIIDGKPVTKPSPEYVTIFQHYGLLPWQSVERNVMLGLLAKKTPKEEARRIADEYLTLVGLEKFKDARPVQLSGGQQQRVSIARALAVSPEILFMDEPFAALDAINRLKMQDDVHRIAEDKKITTVFVTHDIEEAVTLADRIVIMTPNPGRIKSIVSVPLGRNRDRTAEDFLKIRDKVFEIFEMKPDKKIEYYI